MKGKWVFVALRKELGETLMVSGFTEETYVIKKTGTWVPEEDLDWLMKVEKHCPICGASPVKAFHRVTPTEKQMSTMPKKAPKKKEKRSKQWAPTMNQPAQQLQEDSSSDPKQEFSLEHFQNTGL